MKRPTVLFLAFALVCGLGPAGITHAERSKALDNMIEGVASGGGSLLVEAAFKAAASYLYNNHCGTASHDVEQLVCGALGSFTGAEEQKWKDSVTNELTAIRNDLQRLEQGQKRIQADVKTLIAGNQALLAKVSTLVNETVAQTEVRQIQSLWDQQFETLFSGGSSFSKDRLLSFAEQIVKTQQMHTKLGVISRTLTTSGIGGSAPLLQAWAQSLHTQLNATSAATNLEVAYAFLEQNFADLLFEQRQGYLMYEWAAEILESECEIRPAGCAKPPLSGPDFDSVFDKQVAKQLAAFSESVEWLVLANSDSHSAKATFLHPDAEKVFWRLDLFTGANTQKFGLHGRVISMGDVFNVDQLQTSWQDPSKGFVRGPDIKATWESKIPTEGGKVDWWRASKSGVFDEVHFADNWRVRHYHNEAFHQVDFRVFTGLVPNKGNGLVGHSSAWKAIQPIDLRTGKPTKAPLSDTVKLFGTFTGLERVGGGYALMSGEWTGATEPTTRDLGSNNVKDWAAYSVTDRHPGGLKVGVETRGSIYTHKTGSSNGPYQESRVASAQTKKKIRFVDGGNLLLNIEPTPGHFVLPYGGTYTNDYAPSFVAVGLKTSYHRGGVAQKPASLEGKAALVFGLEGSTNGFVRQMSWPAVTDAKADHVDWEPGSVRVTLEKGKTYPLAFVTSVSVKQRPDGLDASDFALIAQGHFTNVYLTLPVPKR